MTRTRSSRRAASPRPGVGRIHVVDLDAARDGGDGERRGSCARSSPRSRSAGPGRRRHAHPRADRRGPRRGRGSGRDRHRRARGPALLREIAGRYPERIVLGLDTNGGQVATRGWREVTARTPDDVLAEFGDAPARRAALHRDRARRAARRDRTSRPPPRSPAARRSRSSPPVASARSTTSSGSRERASSRAPSSAGRSTRARSSVEAALARLAAC